MRGQGEERVCRFVDEIESASRSAKVDDYDIDIALEAFGALFFLR